MSWFLPFIKSATGKAIIGSGISSAIQARSVKKQLAFQRDMSNTSYQRAVADMKKAGINPMVAYTQGGASSPSGASVGVTSPMSEYFSAQQAKATTRRIKAEAKSAEARSRFDKQYYDTLNNTGGTAAKALSDGYGGIVSGARNLYPRKVVHKYKK